MGPNAKSAVELHAPILDSHTLGAVIAATERLIGHAMERAYLDKGYRGHDTTNPRRVFISGQKRGMFGVGRAYRSDDWPLTLVFGIGARLTSILIMLLYMTNDAAPSGFCRDIARLYVIPAAVTL